MGPGYGPALLAAAALVSDWRHSCEAQESSQDGRRLDSWPEQGLPDAYAGSACTGQAWKWGFHNEIYDCQINSGGEHWAAGTCAARKLGLSQACGYCLGHLVHCGVVNCFSECCKGRCPLSHECRNCNSLACNPAFVACAGVPPPGESAVEDFSRLHEAKDKTLPELYEYVGVPSAEMLSYFQYADTNDDGWLSDNEFWLFVGDTFGMPSSSRFSMFALLDKDVNGLLAYSEFLNGFSINGTRIQLEWLAAGTAWEPNFDMYKPGQGYPDQWETNRWPADL